MTGAKLTVDVLLKAKKLLVDENDTVYPRQCPHVMFENKKVISTFYGFELCEKCTKEAQQLNKEGE